MISRPWLWLILPVAAHLLAGGIVAGVICTRANERANEVAVIRASAEKDRTDTERLRSEASVVRALRDGMRTKDPYVVELLARDRLGVLRSGEIPAPVARVDNSRSAQGAGAGAAVDSAPERR